MISALKMRARSILITGASSGIGQALALAYARAGVRLALIARDAERLRETADEARRHGAEVDCGLLDVRQQDAMAAWIKAADGKRPIDLAIANAGITTGLGPNEAAEDPAAVRAIIGINLIGVLNTIEPLIPSMLLRGVGHIVFMGSIAGLRGLPYAPAYCATKAAIHAYSESLRGRLGSRGVRVTLIVPGFVKTPLNDSIDAMKPQEMSAADAAVRIQRGLDKDQAVVAFPAPLYYLTRLAKLLPITLVDKVMSQFKVNVPRTEE